MFVRVVFAFIIPIFPYTTRSSITFPTFQRRKEGGPLADWLRPLIISALNRSSSNRCGFEPRSGHMWDKPSSASGWSGGFFPGIPLFRPTYRLTRLKMNEIILTGRKTQIKKKANHKKRKDIKISHFRNITLMIYVWWIGNIEVSERIHCTVI